MRLNDRKEALSRAYVSAVAASAGFAIYQPSVDNDSIDVGLAASDAPPYVRRPRLELQLKCTAAEPPAARTFTFAISSKNYNDLRLENLVVPRILVILLVPRDPSEWLVQTEQELSLRRCSYWVSLRGMADKPNSTSVSVAIPRDQIFSPEGLRAIMKRIDGGGLP